jgi:hypothetical protein
MAAIEGSRRSSLSGARLVVVNDNVLRKQAVNASHNSRLKLQYDKMRRYRDRGLLAPFFIPRVYGGGIDTATGLYYYEMDLIPEGIPVVQYIKLATRNRFADTLCEYFRRVSKVRNPCEISKFSVAIGLKLEYLSQYCDAWEMGAMHRGFVKRKNILDGLPATCCHGDLSFDNMVITDSGDIYVVDLLDPPYSHYFFDVSKLHMELDGEFYLMTHPDVSNHPGNTSGPGKLSELTRAHILMKVLDHIDPRYREVSTFLLALNFARVLPYVKTQRERNFLHERIRTYCEDL